MFARIKDSILEKKFHKSVRFIFQSMGEDEDILNEVDVEKEICRSRKI